MSDDTMPEGEDDDTDTLSGADRMLFYSSVGQGISLWASMESCLIEIAARLLNTTGEKTGLIFYSINNFYTWLAIIDELFSMEPEYASYRSKFTLVSAALRGLNDTRARLAHHTVFDIHPDAYTALRPGRYDSRRKSRRHAPLTSIQIVKFSQAVVVVEKELRELLINMDLKIA